MVAINDKSKMKLNIIECKENESAAKFSVTMIDNLNEIFSITETFFDAYTVSDLSKYIILASGTQLFLIDVKTKKLISKKKCVTKNFKTFSKICSIQNTNDFIALTNSSQIVYIQHNEQEKTVDTIIQNALVAKQIEIVKQVLVVYNGASQLLVYNLNNCNFKALDESPSQQIIVNNLKHFTISPECNYMAFYEAPKYLSLYRLKDCSKCAYVELYSAINAIILTEKYVSLAMKNRRILSYLIVDPFNEEHQKRIKELRSRFQLFQFIVILQFKLIKLFLNKGIKINKN